MRQEGFRPIGQTGATVTQKSQNEVGSNAGQTAVAASQGDTRVAAWLARQVPEDMDKAAVSRASQHGVGLRVRYEGRFPSGPNGERLPSYMVAVACEVSPSGNHAAALADLRNFMTPAPQREIEGWLAVLSVTVAKRRDDDFAEELRLTVYASRLAKYPADVVREVTHSTYKFWPTWEEIEKRCEALTSPRRQMIAALERGPEPPEKARPPTTEEERKRVQRLVDGMFPSISQEQREMAADAIVKANSMADENDPARR